MALRSDPDRPEVLHLLAAALATPSPMRDTARATVLAEWAADLAPTQPDVHANVGYVLKAVGRYQDAETVLRLALAATRWAHAAAGVNLVNLMLARGANDEAVSVAQRVASSGGSATSFAALARALEAAERLEEAIASWRTAIELEPQRASHRLALGRLLAQRGDEAAATEHFEEALRLDPDRADAWTNLGVMERSHGLEDLAIWFHKRATVSGPDHADAWTNLAVTLLDRGALAEGRAALREAIRSRPDHADAHMALGMSLLVEGRFTEGFAEYEHRLRSTRVPPFAPLPGRMWDGREVAGQHLFLVAEQGFGDAIQFVRYAAALKELGAEAV